MSAAPQARGGREEELEAELRRLRSLLRRLLPDLRAHLRHRGFVIHCEQAGRRQVLRPLPRFLPDFLRAMARYSFRLFLRDLVAHADDIPRRRATRFLSAGVYADYLDRSRRWGLVLEKEGRLFLGRSVPSFGPTLEWWIARELGEGLGHEALWGVRLKGRRPGGDYDVLARVEERILYLEAKSSPPKQVMDGEMDAFLARTGDLGPDLAVFFMDTELRMKDKIVPMLEAALARRSAGRSRVERLEGELFHRDHRLYVVNARGGVRRNLARVIADHLRFGRPGPASVFP